VTSYKLAEDADTDLQNIYLYTLENWGEQQAEIYINGLFARFATLASHPEMGRLRTELGKNIRSFVHKRHVVYYIKMTEGVGISRVLHASMDVENSGIFEE
jgi:toxin ParE1/3/4